MIRFAWSAMFLGFAAAGQAAAQTSEWHFMGDARLYGGYFNQTSRVGSSGFTSSSWVMLDVARKSESYELGIASMLSGDPLLNGECGQPRLLPSAFDCGDSKSLSHPVVMELGLSAGWSAGETRLHAQASVVGEPAFGPPPHFMRASAAFDPAEPLMHHYFTPAHSAHGVILAGVTRGRFSAEASAFNGTNTHDSYRIDLGPLHAYAGRLSVTTSPQMKVQLSAAYFPEEENGGHHGHAGDMRAYSATAAGRVRSLEYTIGCALHRTVGHSPGGCMIENTLTAGRNVFFMRAEGGPRLEQTLETEILPDGSHAHFTRDRMLHTGEVAVGYVRDIASRGGVRTSIGGRAAVTMIPAFFEPRYQERRATSFLVFLSARPVAVTPHH